MIEQFMAICPRSGETALFVYDAPRDAYLCTCSRCKDREACRSAVLMEQLVQNPDGDFKVQRCFCYRA